MWEKHWGQEQVQPESPSGWKKNQPGCKGNRRPGPPPLHLSGVDRSWWFGPLGPSEMLSGAKRSQLWWRSRCLRNLAHNHTQINCQIQHLWKLNGVSACIIYEMAVCVSVRVRARTWSVGLMWTDNNAFVSAFLMRCLSLSCVHIINSRGFWRKHCSYVVRAHTHTQTASST